MIKMLRLLVIFALFIGGVGVVLFQIIRFLGMTRWSSSRRKKERLDGQQLAYSNLDNPVHWGREEYELLSQNLTHSRKKGVFSTQTTGALSTIYSESFISFVIKQYHDREWLISVSTDKDQYSVYKNGHESQVWKRDDLIGVYSKGKIMDQKGGLLGELQKGTTYHTVQVQGVSVAHLNAYEEKATINQRAFQLVHEERIAQEVEWVFTIIVVMFLLEEAVLG